jgi:hypothetical protein
MASSSILSFDLNQPGVVGQGVNDLLAVEGNVTLDGTLNIRPLQSFGPGSYTVMTFDGQLTYDELDLGSTGSFICPRKRSPTRRWFLRFSVRALTITSCSSCPAKMARRAR